MTLLAFFDSFEYLCHGSTAIINLLNFSVRGPSLDSSIDVRLTYKASPRAERVNDTYNLLSSI